MNKDELIKMYREYNFLSKYISIGYKSETFCIVKKIFSKKYAVFFEERGTKFYYKEFNDVNDAYEYLWEIFGGNEMFNFLLKGKK